MKPRVYGFCDAGCKRETILKEDFDRIASVIKQVPDANGTYILNPLNAYKVHTTKSSGAYKATFTLQGNGVDYWFDCSEFDEYRDYIIFEILSLSLNEAATELTIVYEINGNRYLDIYTDNDTVFNLDGVELQIIGATDVYAYNTNAEILADAQQTYETAVESEGDQCPDTLPTEELFTIPAEMYAGQRTPKAGDLLIYRFNVANANGQDIILCKITSVDNQGGVNMQAICFVQGAGASGGGGTTLNKFTFRISGGTADQTAENRARVYRIFEQAKGNVTATVSAPSGRESVLVGHIDRNGYLNLSTIDHYYFSSNGEHTTYICQSQLNSSGTESLIYRTVIKNDGSIEFSTTSFMKNGVHLTYWNDVEIV